MTGAARAARVVGLAVVAFALALGAATSSTTRPRSPSACANHQAEFDAHPLHLCPVDLRKLWSAVGFDVAAREDALAAVWTRGDDGVAPPPPR